MRIRKVAGICAVVAVAYLSNSCAATANEVKISKVAKRQVYDSVLDTPLSEVRLRNIRMTNALDTIAQAIKQPGQLYLDYSISYSRQKEYVEAGIATDRWKLRDPRVNLVASNIRLDDVIRRLCEQSGWSYYADTPVTVRFIDDARYFEDRDTIKLYRKRRPAE